jgi:hypothetical protein
MSAFATLYPYILKHIPDHITVVDLGDMGGPSQAEEEGRSESNMGLLGLHILGPAYSKVEKLAEQVSKRVSSASVSEGIVTVNSGQLREIITETNWGVGILTSAVDKIIELATATKCSREADPGSTKGSASRPFYSSGGRYDRGGGYDSAPLGSACLQRAPRKLNQFCSVITSHLTEGRSRAASHS